MQSHIFLSRALFAAIIIPKFSEFIALSIHAFIHNNCLLHCIYLVYCVLVLGNSMSELLFEDFQEHVHEDSEVLFSGQHGRCP
jgi:hypothetical protein